MQSNAADSVKSTPTSVTKRYQIGVDHDGRPDYIQRVPLRPLVMLMGRRGVSTRDIRVYIELLAQMRCRWTLKTNIVEYTLGELKYYTGLDRSAIYRSLQFLEEKRLVEITRKAKARGERSAVSIWLPETWMKFVCGNAKSIPVITEANEYPQSHHFIKRLDLNEFRKVLSLGKAASMVYIRELFLVNLSLKSEYVNRSRPSWIKARHIQRRGENKLKDRSLFPQRINPSVTG